MTAALRFEPGLGPFRFDAGGARDDGVLVPFMATVESAGVSAAGSMVWAAGVSDGDEAGLESCAGDGVESLGNLLRASGDNRRATVSDLGFDVIFATQRVGDVVSRWRCDGSRRRRWGALVVVKGMGCGGRGWNGQAFVSACGALASFGGSARDSVDALLSVRRRATGRRR